MLFEKAPPGHIPLKIDDEESFILIALDFESGSEFSTQACWSADDLMQFGRRLQGCVGQLWNVGSHFCRSDDFAYEDDLPVNVCAIVTNEPKLSHWYDRDGRNRVDLSCENGILRVESRGTAREFSTADLSDAVYFAAQMAAYFPDAETTDVAAMLAEPITTVEFAAIEAILSQLWRAVEFGELTDAQREQILLMARTLQQEQQAAVPGHTARLNLVQAVRFIVRMLRMLPIPDEFWTEFSEILRNMGWLTMFVDLTG